MIVFDKFNYSDIYIYKNKEVLMQNNNLDNFEYNYLNSNISLLPVLTVKWVILWAIMVILQNSTINRSIKIGFIVLVITILKTI